MMEAVALQDEAVYDFEEMSVEDFPSKPWQGVGVVGDGDCHCHWFGCDGQLLAVHLQHLAVACIVSAEVRSVTGLLAVLTIAGVPFLSLRTQCLASARRRRRRRLELCLPCCSPLWFHGASLSRNVHCCR